MTIEEIVQRLIYLSFRAVHYVGEQPFVMSLDDGIALKEAAEILKQQPERKKGHWIHKGCGCFECDQCGELVSTNVYIVAKASARFKFCPSCGADMREGEQDG